MKTILCLLTLSLGSFICSAWPKHYSDAPTPMLNNGTVEQMDADNKRLAKMRAYAALHPYRIVDGVTNSSTGPGWCTFVGRVAQVQGGGIRVDGQFTEITPAPGQSPESYAGQFFVANFKLPIADGDTIPGDAMMRAKVMTDTYKYSTVGGSSRTLRQLDYGKPVDLPVIPLTPEQIAARKKAATEKQQQLSDRTLKYNQELADKGDAYGQMRMGERYLKGEGVEKDLTKARDYLTKSSAQGNATAKALLEKLPVESAAAP